MEGWKRLWYLFGPNRDFRFITHYCSTKTVLFGDFLCWKRCFGVTSLPEDFAKQEVQIFRFLSLKICHISMEFQMKLGSIPESLRLHLYLHIFQRVPHCTMQTMLGATVNLTEKVSKLLRSSSNSLMERFPLTKETFISGLRTIQMFPSQTVSLQR